MGSSYEATLVLKEGFRGAFKVGDTLELEVAGIPPEVKVVVEATPSKDGVPLSDNKMVLPSNLTLTGDDEGDDQADTLTLGVAMGIPEDDYY